MIIQLNGIRMHLLPEKALYLPDERTLCIADWHLGKAAHFRKAGIPMPQPDLGMEFARVSDLIRIYDVSTVVLLGDVFHSSMNNDWMAFSEFIASYAHIRWIVTMGNHDIVGKASFEALNIAAEDIYYINESLCCMHAPPAFAAPGMLYLCGHIHPGCEIRTAARQKFRLPCFHYASGTMTLPAFGSLTGLYIVAADEQSRIFAILGDSIRELV